MKVILFNALKSFFGVICTIITLLQFFIGTSTYEKLREKLNIPQTLSVGQKVFGVIVIFILVLVCSLIKYNYKNTKAKETALKMHQFHHEIRNETFEMRKLNSQKPTMNHIVYYSYVNKTCYKLCQYIHEFIKNKCGKDFSVCIKMIDDRSLKKYKNIDEAKVYTLCRAGAKHELREENEKNLSHGQEISNNHIYTSVKGNSDFYTIMSNSKKDIATTAFACSNLRMLYLLSKILKSVDYENTTPKFWKHYKSTIVVPIRIDGNRLNNSYEIRIPNNTYQTIAFLCVDYKKPISKALKEELAGYMKSFGDAFFDFFYEVSIMDRNIAIKEENRMKKYQGAK